MLRPWQPDMNRPTLHMDDLRIMDPSAGSGAILAYIHEHQSIGHSAACLHAVESNPACRTLLETQQHVSLEGEDFLQFTPEKSYDLIVMNPPFSNGVKHLIHAWDTMRQGDIVCLLNAESIRNPHTALRKQLVTLIEDHGSVEFIGPVFADAERPTDVEVALVRMSKLDTSDRFHFWNDAYFKKERFDFHVDGDTLGNLPAVNDLIAAIVAQYRQVEGVYVEYLKARRRLRYHVKPLLEGTYMSTDKLIEQAEAWNDDPRRMMTKFMKVLSEQGWRSIMARTRISDLMSESVRRDFEQMQDSQSAMAFTEENIHALFALLFENQHKILQRSVEESFDLMTRYHKENRVHVEGWLSNDAFKVSRKVVLPGMVRLGYIRGMDVCDYGRKNLNDIDRGIAMVEGRKLSQVRSVTATLEQRFKDLRLYNGAIENNTCESEYFHIRFFKKGTLHLTWLDDALRDRFNIAAAQCKKWLPMDHGRRPGEANSDHRPERPAQHLINA